MLVAEVHVDGIAYAVDKPYSYLVPAELERSLLAGCRVLVPFGRSNKKVQGLVTALSPGGGSGRMKPIAVQLDPQPILEGELLRMVEFLVRTTFCTYYEAVRTVLPLGAGVEVTEIFQWSDSMSEARLADLPPEEQGVMEFLRAPKTLRELREFLGGRKSPAAHPAVRSLQDRGLLLRSDRIRSRVTPKTIRMLRKNPAFVPERPLPPKQKAVLSLLEQSGPAQMKELCYLCGVTEAVVKALAKKGAVRFYEQPLEPARISGPERALEQISLSPAQEQVCRGILALMDSGRPEAALLHGVTGSGKTQVYLELIGQAIRRERTALMLVPEIALTPQIAAQFSARFGGLVAVIHSGLTPAERMEEWRRIRAGQVKIVVGTRSAVFAPLSRLGLIILDEEGESSYKSDSSPRYHARDIAKLRCGVHGAVLLLGSATPSIDSYCQAQKGGYALFTLGERFARANLPSVYLVDMRQEQPDENLSSLSGVLREQLAFNLQAGEQSILLINRRGYHTYAACMQCGTVLKCPHCDVAMTYHRVNGRLMCHYCGHSQVFESLCPACGSACIKLTGAGTQRLEDELARVLPQAQLLRMDADTTYSRYSYSKSFEAFRQGRYDILLGTQMIAKGLDFPNVTLVGVLSADNGLYAGDYRAGERVFSLITQVVGRSGRGEKAGRAYIQTLNPDNPILGYAANQDYAAFYADEIATRQAMLLPPFCDIAALGFAGADEEATRRAACRALELLREEAAGARGVALKALGVAPAAITRINGKYRFRLILKCRMNNPMRELLSRLLRRCGGERVFSRISVQVDVNGELSG